MIGSQINYPTKYEMLEAFRMCGRRFIERFAQKKGLFLYRATTDDLIEQLSRIYLDENELTAIREHAFRNKNKQITVGFLITATDAEFDPKNLVEELRQAPSTQGAEWSAVVQSGDSVITGSIDYELNKPGRINLLQNETRHVTYSIESMGDNTHQVFVNALSSSDARQFESILKAAVRNDASLNSIDFNMLDAPKTIQFFDDLSEAGLGADWRKMRVNELTFRKPKEPNEVEDDEEGDGIENHEANREELSIINRAILEGKDLRDNPFVKQSENDGYRFSAMTIEYNHTNVGRILEMRAEFKLRPEIFEIKVASCKQLVLEGSSERQEISDLTKDEEAQFVQAFWHSAKAIYDRLVSAEIGAGRNLANVE